MFSNFINEYTIHIGIGIITSMIYGAGLLKTYDCFLNAVKEKSRFKLWVVFSSVAFFAISIVYIFSMFARS